MAEKSGFFNALNVGGEYDRTYNANDYSDNLAVVISTGVLRSTNDDLKVTTQGMTAIVNIGRAWINGHYYKNDGEVSFVIPSAPAAGSRIDRIVLRLDTSLPQRKIYLAYLTGTSGNNPTPPTLVRSGEVYELALADIKVSAGASSASVTDNRSDKELCGWVYSTSGDNSFFTSLDNSFWEWFNKTKDTLSSVTLFKKYTWEQTLAAETQTVQFNIPQYDSETCFAEVYVNGIFDTRHTITNDIITFQGSLIAGTVITVNVYKSIDGTGIESVADEITALQNKVATLDGVSKYTYKCTGLNDNISISQIVSALRSGSYTAENCTPAAAAFLKAIGGNKYLASLELYSQVTIDVVGRLGATSAFLGDGTSATPFIWFGTSLAQSMEFSKKIILDFSKCQMINISCASNTTNILFRGQPLNIKNANIKATGGANSCDITAFKTENPSRDTINIDNCKIEIRTSGNARISEHGNFTNCSCEIYADYGSAYCFKPTSNTMIRLNGGTFLAYGRTATGIGSAIVHVSASETDAVLIAQNIHCPTDAKSGYSQTYLSVATAGNVYFNVVVSQLPASGLNNTVVGQINKSKS